jgi:hypothetical protein
MMHTNFQLVQHHKYSLTELEGMMPWERAIYVHLLVEWVKKENERIKKENEQMKAQAAKAKSAGRVSRPARRTR